MLSFYRGLTAVKQDPTFPINGKFTAYEFGGSNSVYHYVMNANSDTTKDYKIFIHIGGSPVEINVPDTDEIVLKYEYNESQGVLYNYGVLVLRSK